MQLCNFFKRISVGNEIIIPALLEEHHFEKLS